MPPEHWPRWLRREWRRQRNPRYNYYFQLWFATPYWLTPKHKNQIRNFYKQAKNKGLVVDHIVPIRGHSICGLHVPWNLQLLTHEENRAKSNQTWNSEATTQQLMLF